VSLYCVFDGHGGPERADYAARSLPRLLRRHLLATGGADAAEPPAAGGGGGGAALREQLGQALVRSFAEIDAALLALADVAEGAWPSGSTALAVAVCGGGGAGEGAAGGAGGGVGERHLVVASLGDSRAVLARPWQRPGAGASASAGDSGGIGSGGGGGGGGSAGCGCGSFAPGGAGPSCGYVAEVVSVEHTPERERARIDAAGGWVSVESELSIAKIQGMDASDPFVARRLQQGRRLESRVSRLCGELGVSRALGDAGYKGAARMASCECR
jgi:hypothetical protein